eukprot:864316_1
MVVMDEGLHGAYNQIYTHPCMLCRRPLIHIYYPIKCKDMISELCKEYNGYTHFSGMYNHDTCKHCKMQQDMNSVTANMSFDITNASSMMKSANGRIIAHDAKCWQILDSANQFSPTFNDIALQCMCLHPRFGFVNSMQKFVDGRQIESGILRLENMNTGVILVKNICTDAIGKSIYNKLTTEFVKFDEYNDIINENKAVGDPKRYRQPQTVEYNESSNKRTLSHGLIDSDPLYTELIGLFDGTKWIEDQYLHNGGSDVVSIQCQLYRAAKTPNADRLNKHRDTSSLGGRGFRIFTLENDQMLCFVGRNRNIFVRILKPKNSFLILPPGSILACQYEHFLPTQSRASLSVIGRTINGLPQSVLDNFVAECDDNEVDCDWI